VGTHPKKLAILKQLRTHFKAKYEKGVATPFPRVPPHYTPGEHVKIILTKDPYAYGFVYFQNTSTFLCLQ